MRRPWAWLPLFACACTFDYQGLRGTGTEAGHGDVTAAAEASAVDIIDEDGPTILDASLGEAGGETVTADAPLVAPDGQPDAAVGEVQGTDGAGSGGVVSTGGSGTGGLAGNGGSAGSGGVMATGGNQTGGTSGAGGAMSTGGVLGYGGTGGAAGASATGGAQATGGVSATGGITAGGGVTSTGGATGSGGSPGTGGANMDAGTGGCIALVTSATEFAAATQGMTTVVEDFTRDASGAAVPSTFFAIVNGDYYYRSDTLTFQSEGVQPGNDPGTVNDTIAGAYGSIMPNSAGAQARDAIIASFSTPQSAVALAPNDDEGSQVFTLVVEADGQSYTFALPSAHQPFAGAVSRCGATIVAARIVPPIPSQWYRLLSVTFAR